MEIVRRLVPAIRSGAADETAERLVALSDADLEFTSRIAAVEGRTYRGHDGVRAYFEDMAEAWQEWRSELEEISEVGPDTVLADIVIRATGKSGVDIETRSTVIFVLSSGRLLRVHSYPSRQEALEAAGLAE